MFELEVSGRPDAKQVVPVRQLLDAIRANRGAVCVRHAVIGEPIDFAAATFSHKLIIQDTVFTQPVTAVDGHFRKSVDLSGCEFRQGLDATGCAVDGSLTLNDVTIREGPRPQPETQPGAPFTPPPSFRLLRVQGNVHARNLKSEHALNFSDARIAGDLDLTGAEIVGGIAVETAVIGGSLAGNRVRLTRRWPDETARDGDGASDAGVALAQDGGAWLSGVRVSGGVSFSGADIAQGLALLGVSIKIGLFCGPDGSRPTSVGGDVLLDAAKVGHVVDFTRCHIKGSLRVVGGGVEGSLVCDGATVGTHRQQDPELLVKSDEGATGNAVLVGLRVTGHASFNGAFIERELNLQSAEIKGGLFCRPQGERQTWIGGNAHLSSVKVAVEVGLSGVRIDGDLLLTNAVVEGSLVCNRPPAELVAGGHARPRPQVRGVASLDGIRVQGQVNFQGAALEKGLNLQNATIQSGLACQPSEGQVTEIKEGLSLVGAHVCGGVNVSAARVGGTVNLEDAVIEGDLVCQDADVTGEMLLGGAKITDAVKANRARVKSHLNMQGTVVQGTLSCFPVEVGGGVDMRSAWIHDADLDFRLLDSAGLPDLQLDRCQFQELPWFPDESSRPAPRGEKSSPGQRVYLSHFLEAANHPFCKSNYLLMEKLLRNSGEEEWADQVSRSRRAEDRKQKATPLRFMEWLLLDLATGYGTRTHRLFWVFVLLLGLTTVFFLPREAVERAVQVTAGDVSNPQAKLSRIEAPEDWNWTDALLLSFRVNLPMVNLMSGGDCKPSGEPVRLFGRPLRLQLGQWGLAVTCEGWATFVSLLSYIVVPLFAAGVLGFIKKQQ
jgi:hypothetical protein